MMHNPQVTPLTLNILSWNVGGLNGSTTKYKVKDFYVNT